ncbi:hypothetical protein TEU_03340 [Thermococcus eurythermalis]|uniref:Uncharacterized protein n=1 Tax=Thermococcus eurythermalis TaxID=1505907 RepID=A0A097QSL7_9EURY|nr:hypothetical protein [Thermococcus eurythermalis]AIU69457.1 hypothetical protein TEU_03340 [Thermococcus eurythermalis]
MGDKVRTIISASYSKSLKKFYTTSKQAERRRKKLIKYLDNSVTELRKKATELAESKYSIASENEEARKNFQEKLKTFFKQIQFTKILLSENIKQGLLNKDEAEKYMKKFDELEKRTYTLFKMDAIRDSANSVTTDYEKYLKYRFMDKDAVIKRLQERANSEKDPKKREKLLKKIKEIEKESKKADVVLKRYEEGLSNYMRDIMKHHKMVDDIYHKAKEEASEQYNELKKKAKKSKSQKSITEGLKSLISSSEKSSESGSGVSESAEVSFEVEGSGEYPL